MIRKARLCLTARLLDSFLATFPIIVLISSFAVTASAANITISGYVTFLDTRWRVSNVAGSRLTQTAYRVNRNVYKPYLQIYSMNGNCRDNNPDPDFPCTETDDTSILVVLGSSNGYYSASIQSGLNPYLVFSYSSDAGYMVDDGPGSGRMLSISSWIHYNLTTNHTIDWNITCWHELNWADCGSGAAGEAKAVADYPTEMAYANILQSIGDVDRYFADVDINGYGQIHAHYPNDSAGHCVAGCMNISINAFCCPNGIDGDNHAFVHEIGHTIHKRLMDFPGSLTQNTSCANGHNWTSNEDEKCAFAEGWANFVSGATHFTRATDMGDAYYGPVSQILDGDTTQGNSGTSLPCVSDSLAPEKREGNVTRFFWDVYDNPTSDDENLAELISDIDLPWYLFGDHNSDGDFLDNHETEEEHCEIITQQAACIAISTCQWIAGACSDINGLNDGRNVWDYDHYAYYHLSLDYIESIELNCISGQTAY